MMIGCFGDGKTTSRNEANIECREWANERDPQVHYDGTRAIFAYLEAGTRYYHLYEIQLDGTGLRQMTDGPYDDYEPTYLPDGGIAFVSTRCRSWVACWMTQVGTLYRCEADGSKIRRLSFNTGHDNTPWVLPDGRIMYTRWEYVDRSHVDFHHLWTMMIDAKPIPESDKKLATFSPGHGITDHLGYVTILSPKGGPDDLDMVRSLSDGLPLIKDPYPLSDKALLVAQGKEIHLMDVEGNTQELYTWPGEGEVYEPRAIRPRRREPVILPRVDWQQPAGTLILANVYHGRHLEGVHPGEIKRLLVLEDLPKPVSFSDDPDLVSWLGTFTLKRILGTVPVEEDGSACFEVPRRVSDPIGSTCASWCGSVCFPVPSIRSSRSTSLRATKPTGRRSDSRATATTGIDGRFAWMRVIWNRSSQQSRSGGRVSLPNSAWMRILPTWLD